MDISSSLAGLSLLTSTNAFATYGTSFTVGSGTSTIETNAQRRAHALFTTPATTAPWTTRTSDPSVDAVQAMRTIIDAPGTGGNLPDDVQTDFTVYKALNRLSVLAGAATATGTSDARRASLQASFAQGLSQLQAYMASAPGEQLTLAFNQPGSTAKSIAVNGPPVLPAIVGEGVVASRYDALPGLSGDETLSVTLSKGQTSDTVTVDLSQTAQPPTLDSVAGALNAAIAAIPLINADGSTATDADGNAIPRWAVSFAATKNDGEWGLTLNRTGNEQVSLRSDNAIDSLVVAANVTLPGAAVAARVIRFDDPAGDGTAHTEAMIAGVDPTARISQAAAVAAPTQANGIAIDPQGFSYVVGTTSGDLGSALSSGTDNLFLTKLDSRGDVVWQRDLGTGAGAIASGTAVTLVANGDIVVAGTATGGFQGSSADGDMFVARYSANGDQQFANLIRSAGGDQATSVAVGLDGTIYVGGRTAANDGAAFVATLDASGHLQQRTSVAGSGTSVSALAIGKDGALLALTQQGADATLYRLDAAQPSIRLGAIDLGDANGRALTVADDGTIAVGGATLGPLAGAQINANGGGRDGFVTRVSADLSSASTTYFATAGDDQVDSLAYMNGALYAGGRTTGELGGGQTGTVDGFIGRIDPGSGAIAEIDQFGQAVSQTGAVHVAAAAASQSAFAALGFTTGNVTPQISDKLVTQTSLMAGDSFSIRVNGGSPLKFTIGANDTLATLAQRLQLLTGGKATVTTPVSGSGRALQIVSQKGASIELIAGSAGSDALSKLGLSPQTLSMPVPKAANAPAVTPGGRYGLNLTTALSIGTAQDAAAALTTINRAISMTQTAYRSLYWDSTKAAMANGTSGSSGSSAAVAAANAQTAQYQAALNRLTASTTASSTTSLSSILGTGPLSNGGVAATVLAGLFTTTSTDSSSWSVSSLL